jgi:hypothetical protein
MLTAATIGMVLYAAYSIVWALIDLVAGGRVEAVADVGLVAFGLLLLLSAAFVRVLIPGGLALAIGALLGLQALAVHNDSQSAAGLMLLPQLVRAGVASLLVALAYFGARRHGGAPPEGSGRL